MYKPSLQQLRPLIDMIVEAIVLEIEAETQDLLTTKAAPANLVPVEIL